MLDFKPDPELAERIRDKEAAIVSIEEGAQWLQAAGREPDAWQRACFVEALQAVFSGLYDLAPVVMSDLATQPKERSPDATVRKGRSYDQANLQFITRTLHLARGENVRRHPFGQTEGS